MRDGEPAAEPEEDSAWERASNCASEGSSVGVAAETAQESRLLDPAPHAGDALEPELPSRHGSPMPGQLHAPPGSPSYSPYARPTSAPPSHGESSADSSSEESAKSPSHPPVAGPLPKIKEGPYRNAPIKAIDTKLILGRAVNHPVHPVDLINMVSNSPILTGDQREFILSILPFYVHERTMKPNVALADEHHSVLAVTPIVRRQVPGLFCLMFLKDTRRIITYFIPRDFVQFHNGSSCSSLASGVSSPTPLDAAMAKLLAIRPPSAASNPGGTSAPRPIAPRPAQDAAGDAGAARTEGPMKRFKVSPPPAPGPVPAAARPVLNPPRGPPGTAAAPTGPAAPGSPSEGRRAREDWMRPPAAPIPVKTAAPGGQAPGATSAGFSIVHQWPAQPVKAFVPGTESKAAEHQKPAGGRPGAAPSAGAKHRDAGPAPPRFYMRPPQREQRAAPEMPPGDLPGPQPAQRGPAEDFVALHTQISGLQRQLSELRSREARFLTDTAALQTLASENVELRRQVELLSCLAGGAAPQPPGAGGSRRPGRPAGKAGPEDARLPKQRRYVCTWDRCGKEFAGRDVLRKHVSAAHLAPEELQQAKK